MRVMKPTASDVVAASTTWFSRSERYCGEEGGREGGREERERWEGKREGGWERGRRVEKKEWEQGEREGTSKELDHNTN